MERAAEVVPKVPTLPRKANREQSTVMFAQGPFKRLSTPPPRRVFPIFPRILRWRSANRSETPMASGLLSAHAATMFYLGWTTQRQGKERRRSLAAPHTGWFPETHHASHITESHQLAEPMTCLTPRGSRTGSYRRPPGRVPSAPAPHPARGQ